MIKIEKWLKNGWNLYKDNFRGLFFLYVIYITVGLLTRYMPLLSLVVMPSFFGSIIIITLRKIRSKDQEKVFFWDFNDLFSGYAFFFPLLISSMLVGLFILLGVIAFIIPAIIVASFYLFAVPIIVDQKMDFWGAMETSRKRVMGNLLGFIILTLTLFSLIIIGTAFLGIGILITLPISINTLVYAYLDVFEDAIMQ